MAPDGHPAFKFHRSFRHPPLHSACDCSVAPG
jgi:hypothetical protein